MAHLFQSLLHSFGQASAHPCRAVTTNLSPITVPSQTVVPPNTARKNNKYAFLLLLRLKKKHFYLAGPCRDISLSPIWSRRWYPNKSGSFRIFSDPLPLPYSVDRHWQVLGCHRIAAFAALLFHMSDCMMTRGTILTSVRSQHLRCLYV